MALASCRSTAGHSGAEKATGCRCDAVMSASVAPTGWGCQHSVPLCTSTVSLPVAWHRPGIRMEGLDKCVCLKGTGCTLKEFPHLTSMLVCASVTETVSGGLDKILLSHTYLI